MVVASGVNPDGVRKAGDLLTEHGRDDQNRLLADSVADQSQTEFKRSETNEERSAQQCKFFRTLCHEQKG